MSWDSLPRSIRHLRSTSSVTHITCRNSEWRSIQRGSILRAESLKQRSDQMDLTLSDEQRLLRESVDRFIAEAYNADHRRRAADDPLGFSPQIWKQFAELGWLALPIQEAYGGLGGGAIETGILMEAFGRGLVAEPYLATVVIGATLITECGSEEQKATMLPKVADGSLLLSFAHSERQARFELADVKTSASETPDGWRLDGHKIAVLDGHAANQIIVSARQRNEDGAVGTLCLFVVPTDTAG